MSAKGPSPLLGFNTNVRHKGKVYHIQTEDSGVGHPHIITHLFADGGRILKSKKTSYAEHLGKPDMAEVVRKMMQAQHKEMFLVLQSGIFDEPGQAAGPNGGKPAEAAPVAPPEVAAPAPTPAPTPEPPRMSVPVPLVAKAPSKVAAEAPKPAPAAPPAEPGVRVDVRPVIDLTPGRYSSTRAPEIFRTPDKAPPSLFGEEHISEKSLDEVIMSYLAEDLGED
jgi:hypothetical protein